MQSIERGYQNECDGTAQPLPEPLHIVQADGDHSEDGGAVSDGLVDNILFHGHKVKIT